MKIKYILYRILYKIISYKIKKKTHRIIEFNV